MPTMDKAERYRALYVMLKGEPGVRKSTQALSFPTPQYWFSWDKKMDALWLPIRNWGINPADLDYDDYDDWNQARVKLEQLQIKCKFKTLIFDSITSAADLALRQTLKAKVGTTRSSGAAAGRVVAGIPVNEIEDYSAEASALMELIALSKDIWKYHGVNIILIAHVIQAEYKTTGGVTHMSRTIVTAGKRVAPKIPAYCQEVYHFNIKGGMREGAGGQYSLLTTHTGDDFARTSLPLPEEIIFGDDPLYTKWIEPAIRQMKGDTNESLKTPTPPTPTPITKQ